MGDEKKPQPMALGEAVAKGIIANQTLGYFIGRTFMFLKRVGLNTEVQISVELATKWNENHQADRSPDFSRVTIPHCNSCVTNALSMVLMCCSPSARSGCASGNTCSTRWRTTQRTAGMRRWSAPTAGLSASALRTAQPLTCG